MKARPFDVYIILVIIIIQLACAYNIDDLYLIGLIDPSNMEMVVYIRLLYCNTRLFPNLSKFSNPT